MTELSSFDEVRKPNVSTIKPFTGGKKKKPTPVLGQ